MAIVAGLVLVVIGLSSIAMRPADPYGPGSVVLPSDSPGGATAPPLVAAFSSPTLEPTPVTSPNGNPNPSPTPSVSPSPTPVNHTVTRIVFVKARIDLPVITAPTDESFPYCDVAERMAYYGVPGAGWVTYLYAHSTHYMFGGLVAASWQPDAFLLGQEIQIYTSDDLVYTYEVTEIDRHQPYNSFAVANAIVGEALILQACENDDATGPKLIVVARPVKVNNADHATAHPPTAPRVCAHGY